MKITWVAQFIWHISQQPLNFLGNNNKKPTYSLLLEIVTVDPSNYIAICHIQLKFYMNVHYKPDYYSWRPVPLLEPLGMNLSKHCRFLKKELRQVKWHTFFCMHHFWDLLLLGFLCLTKLHFLRLAVEILLPFVNFSNKHKLFSSTIRLPLLQS